MDLLPILKNLCNSSISQKEINFLIESSYNISYQYLRHYQIKLRQIIIQDDITLSDMAIDAIALMFYRDENYTFYYLKKSFENWLPKINSEDEAEFFLNKIVAKNAEQYISTLLKSSDPIFAKIFESIRYVIKKGDFKKNNYLGQICIVENNTNEILGKVIDKDSFENIPSRYFINLNTVIKSIFEYLKTETNFFVAIPLNQLVLKVKHVIMTNEIPHDGTYANQLIIEVDEKVKTGLNCSIEKLKSSYLSKNKLNQKEAKSFENALKDISEDLKDGGINPGLHAYLEKYIEGLSKEYYTKNYHSILEYLVKIMKHTIAEEINNE